MGGKGEGRASTVHIYKLHEECGINIGIMSNISILNFLTRTAIAFVVGYILNIVLTVVFLFPLLALNTAGIDSTLELFVLFLSYLVGSIIVFSISTRRPLFITPVSFFARAGTILLSFLIILLCQFGFLFLSAKQFEWEKANSAAIHAEIERKDTYLHNNKDELIKLYGAGCFVLTAQNTTYALDAKYTAMTKSEQFSALMGLNLPKGAQGYCNDSLQYY